MKKTGAKSEAGDLNQDYDVLSLGDHFPMGQSIGDLKSKSSKRPYSNLYWSRIVSMQRFRPNKNERWPMQPDIDIEIETFDTMEYEGEPDWEPIFDPKQFADENDELKMEDYKLKSSLLEQYAIQVTEIRSSIKAKADAMDISLDDPSVNEYFQRKRKGMKHSTKAKNLDGESEKEIKQ